MGRKIEVPTWVSAILTVWVFHPPDSSRSPKTFTLCNWRQRCQGMVLPHVQRSLWQLIEWNDASTDGDLHNRLDKQQTSHSNHAFLRWYRSLTMYMEAQRLCLKVSTATQDLQEFPAVHAIIMNGPLCLSLVVSFIHDLNQPQRVLQSAGRQRPKFIITFHCPALAYLIYDSINNNHSSRTPCHPLCPIAAHLLHAQITSSHSAH